MKHLAFIRLEGCLYIVRKKHKFEGNVAIVTGGAGAVGEAAVRLFVKHGEKVIIAGIKDEAGMKLVASVGPAVKYVHCDVSEEEDVRKAVDLAVEMHGKMDVLFNNAGFMALKKNAVDYDMGKFERVMNVNVKGVMHGIKHGVRVMIGQNKGSIISTESIAGTLGEIMPYSYTASKHAIVVLTKSGAAEMEKYGIRVNCVSLAGMVTNMSMQSYDEITEGRKKEVEGFFESRGNLKGIVLKPEDMAEAALYLASEESKYVSGHNLVFDGGTSVVNHCWGFY